MNTISQGLEHLTLGSQEPVDEVRAEELIRDKKGFSVLDLTLVLEGHCHLDWIVQHQELRELVVKVVKQARDFGIVAFYMGKCLPPLTRLTINDAELYGSFLDSISHLPLTTLSLEGCTFRQVYNVRVLKQCTTLTHLNMKRVSCHFYPNSLLQDIFYLGKKSPTLKIEADNKIPDFTGFQNVLTLTEAPKYRYRLLDATPSFNTLASVLDDVGAQEDKRWEPIFGKTLQHNQCEDYRDASPISCPDTRQRFAAELPMYANEPFWTFLSKENIGLIAAVMDVDPFCDFVPQNIGDTLTAGSFTVTCTQRVDHGGIIQRELQVNDKIMHHLQINWEDNQGIPIEEITRFMNLVFDCEAKTSDAKTLVHCFGGYGRTGTFFGCLIIALLVKKLENVTPEILLDLEALIRGLRQQRGCMIWTEEQLETIFMYAQSLIQARLPKA